MKKTNGFRQWVTELWFSNRDERAAWGDTEGCESAGEYFRKYKYWLKREFKHQQKGSS